MTYSKNKILFSKLKGSLGDESTVRLAKQQSDGHTAPQLFTPRMMNTE